MRICWLDVRSLDESTKAAVLEEAAHQRIDGVVSGNPADFAALPPTVKRVLFPQGQALPDSYDGVDVVIVDPAEHGTGTAQLARQHPDVEFGRPITRGVRHTQAM